MMRGAVIAGALCSLVLSACVTEVRPRARSGAPMPPLPSKQSTALPTEPIASPALDADTLTSRVRVAVLPIGRVAFDGQTLPVVSPDGRFLATQVGPTPSWATMLGESGAPLAATRIERYELSETGPRSLGMVDAPVGTLLRQHADAQGFLVTMPASGDDRTIRRTGWLSGGTTGDTISSRLLALPGGRTARTQLEDGALSLVVEAPGEPARVRLLARNAGAFTAFQVFASLQAPAPLPVTDAGRALDPPGFLFFHPGAERMAIYDFSTTALVLLAPRSIAGAWHHDSARWGVFLTTPEGLQYQALRIDHRGVISTRPAVRVLEDAYVPRSTSNPDRPYLLIGPASVPGELDLLWMSPVTEAE